MRYNPKDAERKVLSKDKYPGILKDVRERMSRNQEDMWEIRWTVQHGDKQFELKDFILNTSAGLWKLKKLAVALGKKEEFDEGTFEPKRYEGRRVVLVLGIREAQGNYERSNCVTDYKPYEYPDIPDNPPALKNGSTSTPPQLQIDNEGELVNGAASPVKEEEIPF